MIILPIGDENPSKTTPFVNYALILANTVVFATYAFSSRQATEALVRHHGLVPADWGWETLGSSMFLHGGFAHLLGNMLFLWITGDNVEDRLGHLGYLFFYATAGACAGLAHVYGHPDSRIPCVGASGAISGVMAGYLVLFPFARIRFWALFFFFIIIRTFTFTLPALLAIGLWFGEQLLLEHFSGRAGITEVAYDAHIGGFVAGLAVVGLMRLTGLAEGGPRRGGS